MAQKRENVVALKELRNNIEEYIERINNGERFTVFKRSKPVFKITPIAEESEDDGWETIIDFTKIRKGGVPLDEVRAAIRKALVS